MTEQKKSWIKCLKCGSYISTDTGYQYIPCACGAVAVDGGPEYTRIIGDSGTFEVVSDNDAEKE